MATVKPGLTVGFGKPTELYATEMSTVRMHHGEPHVTIWVTGPKGGSKHMLRFDTAEANKLLRALARACAYLEEGADS